MGGAPRNNGPCNGSCAAGTREPRALEYPQGMLMARHGSAAGEVARTVTQACATMGYSLVKHMRYGAGQTGQSGRIKIPSGSCRVYSGVPERLVGVDISQPGDDVLIKKKCLDHPAPLNQRGKQCSAP